MSGRKSRKREAGQARILAAFGVLAVATLTAGAWLQHRADTAPPPDRQRPPSLPAAQAIIPTDILNVAKPKVGAEIWKMCASCHGLGTKQEPNKVGPPLADIVGAPIASRPDYDYSPALKRMRGRFWTTDELYLWLRDPAGYAPGTKMRFGGLLDPQDRADMIAYLITLKPHPEAEEQK